MKKKNNGNFYAAVFHRLIPQPVSGRSSALPFLAAFLVWSIFCWLLHLHNLFLRPNGFNRRMFKKYLSDLSQETDLLFYVCHYPSGTSKYNPIEHRLFSAISKSIQAQPLTDIDTSKELLNHTTTTTGLRIKCVVDENTYTTKQSISQFNFNKLPVKFSNVFNKLNYIVGKCQF